MTIFSTTSFEPELLKKGISGNVYDLSFNSLMNYSLENIVDILSNEYYGLDIENIVNKEKSSLLKILNNKLLQFHHPDNIELFGVKDPRKEKLSNIQKELYSEKGFPEGIITTLTHGSYSIPSNVRFKIKNGFREEILKGNKNIKKEELDKLVRKKYLNFLRILKHYSDFGTRYLVNNSFIPKKQVIHARNSRSIKDPARHFDEGIREKDFSDNILPKGLENGDIFGKLEYLMYHLKIDEKINEVIEKQGGSILIDDHDTGVLKISENGENDKYREGGFPVITLGTLDGESCNPEIVEYYTERLKFHLGVDILINTPYKGGYVTQKHGVIKRKKLKEDGKKPMLNNVIQQEVGKFLYLDEKTQKVDKEKARIIGIGLARAKADLGRKFGKEYFKSVEKGDEYVKKYLDEYD